MRAALLFFLALLPVSTSPLLVAQNCPVPPVLQPLAPGLDIFSDAQESDLGDAMAEQIAPRLKIIENDVLTDYLRVLGNRLVRHLPPNKLNFRFYLVELSEPNAYSIAGGRVYISRKMIAFAHNEDELAGVIAHELGHIVTHQSGIEMSRRFREVLGVTQVGDRADIFAKFHQYLENYRRKSIRADSGDKEQAMADQVGLFTAYRSGYSTQAFVDVLDRLVETHGQTGSWFTDVFGISNSQQRRMRGVMKSLGALPPGCAEERTASSAEAFAKWKEKIVAYSGADSEEVLPGLIYRTALKQPLRPDISNFRFSADGKVPARAG